MQVVVVTGMSGSGKSTVMDVMEDIGYYCIDNLPPQLIHRFVEICRESENKLEKIAIAADLRSGEMFAEYRPLDDPVVKTDGHNHPLFRLINIKDIISVYLIRSRPDVLLDFINHIPAVILDTKNIFVVSPSCRCVLDCSIQVFVRENQIKNILDFHASSFYFFHICHVSQRSPFRLFAASVAVAAPVYTVGTVPFFSCTQQEGK